MYFWVENEAIQIIVKFSKLKKKSLLGDRELCDKYDFTTDIECNLATPKIAKKKIKLIRNSKISMNGLINVQGSEEIKLTRSDRAFSRQYLCATIAYKKVSFLKNIQNVRYLIILGQFCSVYHSAFHFASFFYEISQPCAYVLWYVLTDSTIQQKRNKLSVNTRFVSSAIWTSSKYS